MLYIKCRSLDVVWLWLNRVGWSQKWPSESWNMQYSFVISCSHTHVTSYKNQENVYEEYQIAKETGHLIIR
jgi:hypothetical protein